MNTESILDDKNSDNDLDEEQLLADQTSQNRRIQDSIESKDPTGKMDLDRRLKHNERRTNHDAEYKGPSRRLTIDRRENYKDRRKDEDDSSNS